MAYYNGKRVLFTVIRNGSVIEDVQYEFLVRPDNAVEGTKVWKKYSGVRYCIHIQPEEFPDLENAYIAHAIKFDDNGTTEQIILECKRNALGKLTIITNEPSICKIIIKGDIK